MRDTPRKIWVRAPNWVGDVVMATPALRALRQSHPQAEIVIEARSQLEALVGGLSSVDRFLSAPGRGLRSWLAHAQILRAQGFDWAVLMPDSFQSALPAFLARIPARVGYSRDLARRALLTRSLEPPRRAGKRLPISMIERYLRVTRALGCTDTGRELEIALDESAAEAVRRRLAKLGVVDRDGLLVVTPGASYGSSKLWPAEHFARACDGIADAWDLRVVLAPGPGEEEIALDIVRRMKRPALNLVDPVTTLAELVAVLDLAALALSNDTGPRQIAVALGRPVIVVMGPTDPRHTAHLLDGQRVLIEEVDCSPCHLKTCPTDHRCMTRLAPERVIDAARTLLS
jgi:heptosyltransferase-2